MLFSFFCVIKLNCNFILLSVKKKNNNNNNNNINNNEVINAYDFSFFMFCS